MAAPPEQLSMEELDAQLMKYMEEWRQEKEKEAEQLETLKEQQIRNRELRLQQAEAFAERQRKEEQERLQAIENAKKKERLEKLRRAVEAEKFKQKIVRSERESRQRIVEAKKKQEHEIQLQRLVEMENARLKSGKAPNAQGRESEILGKTKEHLVVEKAICLSIRIKPMNLDECNGLDEIRKLAQSLWEKVVALETERYDLEDKISLQNYSLKELKERQKMQLRSKATKMGLTPEWFTGKYPPKILLASKFERQVDHRTYEEKKCLFEGGCNKIAKEKFDMDWAERMENFKGRQKRKLKWFGERPDKKKGEPPSPPSPEVPPEPEVEFIPTPSPSPEPEIVEKVEPQPEKDPPKEETEKTENEAEEEEEEEEYEEEEEEEEEEE